MFHKELDEGQAGDQLGALLRGIKREQIRRGMLLCQPDTVTSCSKLEAQVTPFINHTHSYCCYRFTY